MTLQHNRVRPINLLFEVGFYNHFTEMITILRRRVASLQHLGRYLECQCHSMTLLPKRVRPITLLFEVGIYNYLTELLIILRRFGNILPIVWLCAYYTVLY